MTGPEIMAVVGFGILVAGVVSGAFWRMWGLIAEARAVGEQAQRNLDAHRLEAAQTYATKAGLTEALGRVHDALDRLTDRIDALIAAQSKPTRSRSQ